MIRTIFILLLLVACNLQVTKSFAQNTQPQERTIAGKKYLVHVVEKGHTLYAISKKYAVDIDYIIKENPGVENSIKIGQEILIPSLRIKRTEAKNSPEIKEGFLIYTVEKKESAYGISRAHNVPLNALYQANPGIEKGIKAGQTVKIPVQAVRDERMQNLMPATEVLQIDTVFGTFYNPKDSLINHIVAAKETMYAICRHYQVSPDSVLELNFGLPLGLLFHDTLRIPKRNPYYKKDFKALEGDIPFSPKDNGITKDSYDNLLQFNNFDEKAGFKDHYSVALMLPLQLEKYLTADESGRYPLTQNNIALQFYQGAMLAIDTLKKMGLSVDVYVYDTKRDAQEVKRHLIKPEFKNMDLIIGPMYRSVFDVVKTYANVHNIKMVCPVPQDNDILKESPFIFKASSSTTTQMRYLAKYLFAKKPNTNLLLIDSKNEKDFPERISFMRTYNYTALSQRRDTVSLVAMEEYTIDSITSKLQPDIENIIVVPSKSVSYVTDLINRITAIPNINDYQVSIYGLENWLKYDKIDSDYKNRFNLHVTSSYYPSLSSPKVTNFYKAYRSKYGTDPKNFSIQGYDITKYFLSSLQRFGVHFDHYASEFQIEGLQTKFKMFRSQETNGFENINVYLLNYQNYELKKIN